MKGSLRYSQDGSSSQQYGEHEELDAQSELERLTTFVGIVADDPAAGQGSSWLSEYVSEYAS
jgi:hypothetical protein